MFSFFRKSKRLEKMFQKLDGLQRLAQLTVILTLQDEFAQEMDKTEAMTWAVAIVNDLFGNPASKISTARLDMDEVSRCANALLENKLDYRELVVQSLRVLTTVHFGRNKQFPNTYNKYERILSRYGGEFPEIPNPEVYRKLIIRTFKSCPLHIQERLKSDEFWTSI